LPRRPRVIPPAMSSHESSRAFHDHDPVPGLALAGFALLAAQLTFARHGLEPPTPLHGDHDPVGCDVVATSEAGPAYSAYLFQSGGSLPLVPWLHWRRQARQDRPRQLALRGMLFRYNWGERRADLHGARRCERLSRWGCLLYCVRLGRERQAVCARHSASVALLEVPRRSNSTWWRSRGVRGGPWSWC
jgi:hypothetical protein